MSGEIQFVSPYMAATCLIGLGVLDGTYAADLESAQVGDNEAKQRLSTALSSVKEDCDRAFDEQIDEYTKIEGVDVMRIDEAGRNPLESSVRFFTMYTEVLTPKSLDAGLVGELAEVALNEEGEVAEVDKDFDRINSEYHIGRVLGYFVSWMGEDFETSFLNLYITCVRELMPIMKNSVVARAHAGILIYNVMEMGEIEDGADEENISRFAAEILPEIKREILSYGDGSNSLYADAFNCVRDKVGNDIAHEIALNSAMLMTAMFEPVEGTYEKWVDLTADTYLELHAMLLGTEIGDVAKDVALIASLDEYSDLASSKKRAIQYKDALIEIRDVVRSRGVVGKVVSDIALEAFASTASLAEAKKYALNVAGKYLNRK